MNTSERKGLSRVDVNQLLWWFVLWELLEQYTQDAPSSSSSCTKGQTEDQDFQHSSCQSTSLMNNCIITLTNECKFKSSINRRYSVTGLSDWLKGVIFLWFYSVNMISFSALINFDLHLIMQPRTLNIINLWFQV